MTGRETARAAALSLLMVLSVIAVTAPAVGAGATGTTATALDDGTAVAGAAGATDDASAAETLVVDGDGGEDYTKISQALFDAEEGDTVEVRPGTYEERTISTAKNVTLVAPDGATLDGSSHGDQDEALRVSGGVVVRGFTVVNWGTGVEVGGSATLDGLTIRNSKFDGVRASASTGDWTIRDSTIEDNGGNGLDVARSSGAWTIDETAIANNGEYGVRGFDTTGDWRISGTTVRDNGEFGVGVTGSEGDWSITDSTIEGHVGSGQQPDAGVAAGRTTGDWTIADARITNNGQGVTAADSTGAWTIVGSNVSANTVQSSQGQSGTNVRASRSSGAWSIHDTRIADSIVGVEAGASTGDWRIRFSNVTGNALGVTAEDARGVWTIRRSAFVDNDVHGIEATGANPEGDATKNWWGQASGPTDDQCVGNVVCDDSLGQSPNQEISRCTVLDQPGNYEVVADLTSGGTCIEINASHVTVEGQGHLIEGTGGSEKVGVYANGTDGRLSDVTVTNLELSGWSGSGSSAVTFEAVDDGEISGVHVTGGDYGFHLVDATSNDLFDNTIAGTTDGQAALTLTSSSNGNTVTNTTVRNAGDTGVGLSSSSDNTFRANVVARSTANNVRVAHGSSGNTFVDNVVRDAKWDWPGQSGFSVGSGSDLVFRNNTVVGNYGGGIALSQAGSNYRIVNNTVRGNGGHGISLKRVSGGVVRDNDVTGNGGHGIQLRENSGHTATDNVVLDNGRWGINVNTVDDADVRRNVVKRHPEGGIRLKNGAAGNTVADNRVVNVHTRGTITWPTGITVDGANGNQFTGNTVVNSYRGVYVTGSASGNSFTDTAVYTTGSGTLAVELDGATGASFDSLDLGDSTAPNTTVSFEGSNVTVGPATAAPSNPSGTGIGRFVNASGAGPGAYLDLTVHYENGDLSGVSASSLSLWTYDGSTWNEASGVTVDASARTVSANFTSFGTHGVFG